jgi:hypothetical protein
MLWIFDDPRSILSLISMCIACLGFYGVMTLGYVIVNKNCGCKVRGAVGVLLVSKIGGIAHDHISSISPFLGTAFFSLVLLCVLLIPKVWKSMDSEDIDK